MIALNLPKHIYDFDKCFGKWSDYSLREINCQYSKDSFLRFAHVICYIKCYIDSCGWSREVFGCLVRWWNKNRRGPIKSSLRLPFLRNRFFILFLIQAKKKWQENTSRNDIIKLCDFEYHGDGGDKTDCLKHDICFWD